MKDTIDMIMELAEGDSMAACAALQEALLLLDERGQKRVLKYLEDEEA